MLLVLWDIDRTLINTGGVGGEIFADAYREATGRRLERMPLPSGHTEPALFLEAAQLNGTEPGEEMYERFARALASGYEQRAGDLAQRGRRLPGAAEALEFLDRAGAAQTVVTGNIRPVAETKLRVFGLDALLDLEAGGYGSDHSDRRALVTLAQARAEQRYGRPFGQADTVVVGDTPADVAAARDHARMIAVASGRSSVRDLAEAGAATVLTSLAELPAVLAGGLPCR
jgi:phosphoglycolate phosphatase